MKAGDHAVITTPGQPRHRMTIQDPHFGDKVLDRLDDHEVTAVPANEPEAIPSCAWCSDYGYARIGQTVLCLSDYEYALLHWR